MKCSKCGFEGTRADFEYVGQAMGPSGEPVSGSYRQCSQCGALNYCDDLEEDEVSRKIQVWGLSPYRGRVFKGKKQGKEIS